jgi:hypothetical protein
MVSLAGMESVTLRVASGMPKRAAKGHPKTALQMPVVPDYEILTRRNHLVGMDSGSMISALIAARIGQAQLAVAARMLRQAESADAATVQQLLAAANRSADALAAAAQQGVGEIVDVYA